MLQLNYRDSKPIYEQIKEGLTRLLLTRAIDTDERLPSVRELAEKLAINPNTIQRAYRELEAEGYIYTVPGKGSFAASREEVQRTRQRELWEDFDRTVSELLLAGAGGEELKKRIDTAEKKRAADGKNKEQTGEE